MQKSPQFFNQSEQALHSIIAWECCIKQMAIPSISDGQSDRRPVSSELMHKITLAKDQKRYMYKCSLKRSNQHFLYKCISTHNVLYNYKVSRNSVERFQRSCANKKNRTDGQTDGRVKNIIPSATRCVGYNNFCSDKDIPWSPYMNL